MKIGRRGFLKLLGGTAAAAVAAPVLAQGMTRPGGLALPSGGPLFIPARNLDMGVPRQILTATEMPDLLSDAIWLDGERGIWNPAPADHRMARTVPMVMLQDNYSWEYGRGLMRAGSTVLVDQETAERWADRGVAVPGADAPAEVQERAAKRQIEREQAREVGSIWGIPVVESKILPENTLALVPRWERGPGHDFDPVAAMVAGVQRSMARRARGPIEYDETWEID